MADGVKWFKFPGGIQFHMQQKWNKFHSLAVAGAVGLAVVFHFIPNNYFFYFIAGAIVLIAITAVAAKFVIQQKAGDGSEVAPWAQSLRQFQDTRENAGWRIERIPFDDPIKPMTIPTNGVAAIGAMAFLSGFVLLVYNGGKYRSVGMELAVGGVLMALAGIWLKARTARRDWQVMPARCIDRELKRISVLVNGRNTWGWVWRIICEYDYLGKEVRVTPVVSRMNFTSEDAAMEYLGKAVSPTGECRLHINPKNLLQTELAGPGIEEKLLYRAS